MLRLTPMLTLLSLPLLLAHLLAFHQRIRPPRYLLMPPLEAVILAAFPVAWFFGFLYYTDIPSLAFVLATVVAATKGQHALGGLVSSLLEVSSNSLKDRKSLAWPLQLHLSPDQHNMGRVRLRCQSAHAITIPAKP